MLNLSKKLFLVLLSSLSFAQIYAKYCWDFDKDYEYIGTHKVNFSCSNKDENADSKTKFSCDCMNPFSQDCKKACETIKDDPKWQKFWEMGKAIDSQRNWVREQLGLDAR